jgi:four helix bundle protein
MRDPRNLEVCELAADLAELTYRVTKSFPPDERFGLVAQMRRASVSIGSNIAEGCGRTSDRAFTNFVQIALGSVLELEYQALIAKRLGHGDPRQLQEIGRETDVLKRKLVSLTNALRRRKSADVPMRAGGAAASPAP